MGRCSLNILCFTVLTRSEYAPFAKSHLKLQQRSLYLSEVNVPPQNDTKDIVFVVAGQQMIRAQSGLTGQRADYAADFKRFTDRVSYVLSPGALVNKVLETGLFPKENTFVGLVFDAQTGSSPIFARIRPKIHTFRTSQANWVAEPTTYIWPATAVAPAW